MPILLGRYELYSIIATGGMASIHLGRLSGPSGFARTVAIKRLHPHFARDPNFVAMFMDEARLVARIRHPNVVPILDVVAEHDELFLVMEYVHGASLSRLVREDGAPAVPVPPATAAAIFAGVLHGLHAAHEAKSVDGEALCIVHRDVTPHNVLVGLDGSSRIADFGIAKATRRDQTTQAGVLKGKLCYVSPEQLQGQNVSPATDVYAAAVSLWETLTGRVLFDADHEAQIMQKILTGCTRPPSALAAGVPHALDEVVMRGLEMKPSKRFASAREMAQALEKSMPFPSSSDIGAWVSGRAQATLAERTLQIETLERLPPLRETSSPRSNPQVESLRSGVAEGEPPPISATVPAFNMPRAEAPTELVTVATPMARPGAASRDDSAIILPMRPSRAPWLAGAALLALLVLGSGALLARWPLAGHAESPARPPSEAALPPPVPTDLARIVPAPEPAPPIANQEPEPQTARPHHHHPGAHADAGAPAAGASAAASPSAGASGGKGKPDDMCNPPYTRDENGAKIYKRECL